MAALLAGLVVVLGGLADRALADGDPASDVLATQPLFLPEDAGLHPAQQAQLGGLLQEAARSGYTVRVALIASSTDLGSVTELWGQPAYYAKFLGQELSLSYRGRLLVIMPAGFGLYDDGQPVAAEHAALSGVTIRPAGAGFGTTAIEAIQRLAAASGHSLPLPRAGGGAGSAASTDYTPWIAFGLGLVLIATAWVASLRAQPLRLAGKDS